MYCVRCGVELAPSEKVCPLCLTKAALPDEAPPKAAERPYPEILETVARIDHRYGAKLGALFLLIPTLLALLMDLSQSPRLTWSAYVLGAAACVFCWIILPVWLGPRRPYAYLAADFLAVAGYLALIGWQSGDMGWYARLGLPLACLSGLACLACVWAARRSRTPPLNRASNMILILACFLLGVEALTDWFVTGAVFLRWSVYALIFLAAPAAILRIVEKNARLKSAILRRLFL